MIVVGWFVVGWFVIGLLCVFGCGCIFGAEEKYDPALWFMFIFGPISAVVILYCFIADHYEKFSMDPMRLIYWLGQRASRKWRA